MRGVSLGLLLMFSLAIFAKLWLLKQPSTRASLAWETRIKALQNVVLYEESKDFSLDYTVVKGVEIPIFSEYLNTLNAKCHGTVTVYYGVTVDSIAHNTVFYTPYSSPPRLELTTDNIDQPVFGEYEAEDANKIQKLALDYQPTLNYTQVSVKFDSIVTALTGGAYRGQVQNIKK